MTEEEKELLLRYQQYTRKRNMIIATIIIVAVTVSLVLGFYFFGKNFHSVFDNFFDGKFY